MDVDKKTKQTQESSENFPNIRIILKSQDVKNLDYVSSKIIEISKEKEFSRPAEQISSNDHKHNNNLSCILVLPFH